jgi:uncharacterized membrane protein
MTAANSAGLPLPTRLTVELEGEERLDPVVDAVRQVTRPLADSPAGPALRGEWMGHALHPTLTDLPLGLWTATSVLDLVGGANARPAAQRLLGVGLIAAGPTALSGWAEWQQAGTSAQRVGLVHAALNITAVGLYAGSWGARRRGRHGLGVALALLGAGAASAGGYLGGHLALVRDVASRPPALDGGSSPDSLGPGTTFPMDGATPSI